MIETARLLLRPFEEADRADLYAMWADPLVTADLGGPRDTAATDALIARHEGYRDQSGLGFWVTRRRDDGSFVGWCGFKPGNPATPIAGELEIGWSLVSAAWGHGFASEAARASLASGWANHAAARIVAITSCGNVASRRVMDRLGMDHVGDFRHPGYAADDPSGNSVLYAIGRPA